jgi:hypothetical protein
LIVVAVAVFVLGVGGCSVLGVVAAVRAFDVDTIFSREGSIDLGEGSYTVYLTNPFASVTITGPDGEPIDLDNYGENDVSVSSGDDDYEATYTFRAPVDGTYRVLRDGEGRVAIGKGIGKALRPLWFGLALGVVAGGFGMVLFIVTLVKRSSSRNRIRAAQFAAAGGWPGRTYQGPGGPTFGPPPTQWGSPPPPPGS